MALLKELPKFAKCPKCNFNGARVYFQLAESGEKHSIVIKIYECPKCGYKGPRI